MRVLPDVNALAIQLIDDHPATHISPRSLFLRFGENKRY